MLQFLCEYKKKIAEYFKFKTQTSFNSFTLIGV
jgi:hypothetical protein